MTWADLCSIRITKFRTEFFLLLPSFDQKTWFPHSDMHYLSVETNTPPPWSSRTLWKREQKELEGMEKVKKCHLVSLTQQWPSVWKAGKRKDSWGLTTELLAANGFWEMGRHNIHLNTHWWAHNAAMVSSKPRLTQTALGKLRTLNQN